MSENEETTSSTETTQTTSNGEGEPDPSLIGGAENKSGEGKGDEAAKEAAAKEEALASKNKTEDEGSSKEKSEDKSDAVILDDIKFPEGYSRNDETLKALTDVLGDKDLSSQESAQALVDLYTKGLQEASEKISEQWSEERVKWVEATKALPKIGGENLDESLGKVARLIDEFGVTTDAQGVKSKELGEQFRQVLDDSGLGDHPTVVRFLVNVADSFSEGGPVSGSAATGERTQAQKMFPEMN